MNKSFKPSFESFSDSCQELKSTWLLHKVYDLWNPAIHIIKKLHIIKKCRVFGATFSKQDLRFAIKSQTFWINRARCVESALGDTLGGATLILSIFSLRPSFHLRNLILAFSVADEAKTVGNTPHMVSTFYIKNVSHLWHYIIWQNVS